MSASALALSERQLRFVRRTANSLPAHVRERFLNEVAARLVGDGYGDAAVARAINLALNHCACGPAA